MVFHSCLTTEVSCSHLGNAEQILGKDPLSALKVVDCDVDEHRHLVLIRTADARLDDQSRTDVLGSHLVDVCDVCVAHIGLGHLGRDEGGYLLSQVQLALAIVQCI